MKKLISIVIVLLAVAVSSESHAFPKSRDDRIIVKFKSSLKKENIADFAKNKDIIIIKQLKKTKIHLIKVKKGKTVKQMVDELKNNPHIEYAEPDYIIKAIAVPNDPGFSSLWGMYNSQNTNADIDAIQAWDIINTNSTIVAVIDTGVDYTHPDLQANMWENDVEIPDNNIDDDGNGFIDDVYGWDFRNEDSDPYDDNSHGTHCAGTIGAEGNNSIGVAGVNWKTRIMALKFLSSYGSGSTSDGIECIEYAIQMGAKVINASWGSTYYSQALKDAIELANASGVLFVAAAGNSGTDNDVAPHYPSSYDCDNIIAVAASDNTDNLAYFSCFGKNSVDIAAPGVSIYSTIPDSSYGYKSGTSMAAPHVAGSAALIMSQFPQCTHLMIKEKLLWSVDRISQFESKILSSGRLNLYKSLLPSLILSHTLFIMEEDDDKPEPSEFVQLFIAVKNMGTNAENVSVRVTSDSSFVEVQNSNHNYGIIETFQSKTNEQAYVLRIADDIPYLCIIAQLRVVITGDSDESSHTIALKIYGSPENTEGKVLIVKDYSQYIGVYTSALNQLSVEHDTWDTFISGVPEEDIMKDYGMVIWFTGDDYTSTLTDEEIIVLEQYLDSGGKLFITGQDIGYDIQDKDFYLSYLHAHYTRDNAGLSGIRGKVGTFMSNTEFSINQIWPDEIAAIYPAEPVLFYEAGAMNSANLSSKDETPVSPDSSSDLTAGIYVEDENYKIVYFAFGFEGIESEEMRLVVMKNVIEKLAEESIEVEMPPADITKKQEDDDDPEALIEDIEIWNNPVNININPEVRILLKSDAQNDTQTIDAGIFDINGKPVKMFTYGNNAGDNTLEIKWDCTDEDDQQIKPGVYFFALRNSNSKKAKQIFLVK